MRSGKRVSKSRYQKDRRRSAGIQWARKPNLCNPDAQKALEELARCFARAAVEAIVADLDIRQLTALSVPDLPGVPQDPLPRPSPLPETGFLRIRDIIGDRRRGMAGLIPVSPATWYSWIAAGRVPKPVKLGRTSVWRVEEIRALIEQLSTEIPRNSPPSL